MNYDFRLTKDNKLYITEHCDTSGSGMCIELDDVTIEQAKDLTCIFSNLWLDKNNLLFDEVET